MKRIICLIAFVSCFLAYSESTNKIAADGFPAGQGTPEGVACDAVRSYINSDHELWLSTLAPTFLYGDKNNEKGAEALKKYEDFKEVMVEKNKQNAKDPKFPKMKIVKVFKARNFTKNGPGSMAYALFEFTGNMFVDILVDQGGEKPFRARYHVMQDKDKKWYFEPRPDMMPFLSMGLNEESESTEEWKKE
ncbi:MAG: hypothetical protein A2X48_04790 [Lentisphaerae bacterium GWF2_49_21]|nr:MAG: hypothetical protein A2X48_04790 [Lentisphaerae bacterium GWF2_49_21]